MPNTDSSEFTLDRIKTTREGYNHQINSFMKTKSPEEILTIIVSGLLRERRFSITVDESDDKYVLHITTVSRNQGRILGGGAATLKSIKSLMAAIDPEIEVILDDPDETTPINQTQTSCAIEAITPWLDSVTDGDVKAYQDNNKIIITGAGSIIRKSIQNDATNVFFSIGRAQGKYAEVFWD